jgi:hypothetical protein
VIDRPRAQDGPTQVSVGIWIADITSIDGAPQSFTAEIAVVLRWKDPSLATVRCMRMSLGEFLAYSAKTSK